MLAKLRSIVKLRTRIRNFFGTPHPRFDIVDVLSDPAFADLNREKLRSFKNIHKGQRCFIIGNGPSLNKIDLHALDDEITFGVNAIFLKHDDIGFRPTYYVVEDSMVMKDNLNRINEIDYSVRFFPARYFDRIRENENAIFLPFDDGFYQDSHPYYCNSRFSKDCSKVIYAGQTVTYLNMQLAYYMGFREVYLIGMDFSYSVPESSKIDGFHILSQENDPNHFHPDYFGKGKTWKVPKLDNCLQSFNLAKKVYEKNGRRIYNATVGGKLELFERVDFNKLFPGKANNNEAKVL